MSPTAAQRILPVPVVAALLLAAGCSSGGSKPPGDDASAVVFRPGQVLGYRVRITQQDLDWIEEHGIDEEWRPASLVVTGLPEGQLDLGQVGFRHKGGVGTLTGCWTAPTVPDDPSTPDVDEALLSRQRIYEGYCARISYKLQFNEYVKGSRFHGLERLNLHAGQRDPTRLHDLLAYDLFSAFGVDAPRTAPARLTIDVVDGAGQVLSSRFMGLFIAVEDVDDRYPKHHYAGADRGNLFKETWPTPVIAAAWGDQTFADILAGQLQTNSDAPDVSDFVAFKDAVASATPASFAGQMAPWIDLEKILRYMAVDRAIGNWDGVTAMYCWTEDCSVFAPHNMYWYHDSGPAGRFHLIPWDMDNTFQDFQPYLHPIDSTMAERPVPGWNVKPASCARIRVWADSHVAPPGCDRFLNLLASTQWDRYDALGRQLIAGPLRASVLVQKAQAWTTLIEPILREDPFVTYDDWRAQKDALVETILPEAAARYADELAEGYHEE